MARQFWGFQSWDRSIRSGIGADACAAPVQSLKCSEIRR
jgi:hypothetical protein